MTEPLEVPIVPLEPEGDYASPREVDPVRAAVTVAELIAGDVVHMAGTYATYVTQLPHPRYGGLRLVVWKLEDGVWSFDALDPRQEVGETSGLVAMEDRVERLREVLGG